MPIRFEKVEFVYGPKTTNPVKALKGIDLEIKEGEFLAVVGRTGCGKSTLTQHMNALLNPSSGDVYIDSFVNSSDKKKRDKKTKPLRHKVGLVFQFPEYQLFEETVEKDVAFGPKNFGADEKTALEKAHAALSAVGLNESFYSRSPFDLSGGEKRRVALAGVLAMEPSYLVLDEPTAGLDPSGAKELLSLLSQVHASGTTIIIVTHDMDVVIGYCQRVVIIDDGRIALDGKPIDLFEKDLTQYSLQTPLVFEFGAALSKRGFHIDKDKLTDAASLAAMIAEGRNE